MKDFLLYILQYYIYVHKVSIVMFSLFEVFLFLRQRSLFSFKFSDNNRQLYFISTLLSMRHLPGKIFDLTPEIIKFPITPFSTKRIMEHSQGWALLTTGLAQTIPLTALTRT